MGDNLAGLAGQNQRKQKSKDIDATVQQPGQGKGVKDWQSYGYCRNKDQLRLLVEMDNKEQQDKQGRNFTGKLRFWEQCSACLDGVVNLARIIDLYRIVGRIILEK